ncbi:U3 small nucleolar RNA-associated protein 15 [Cladophialophora chaetospira]|uniref:U3 small nucleolar RNA-associated protein 15 n=1 Tax=Cladophialophora chaetospira TaxID=386627 RepID=A0AA39CD56_9EURO|nr:U3 small nucleolar RNA-associated protein 15 [Cladophialophora chaetospira]
MAADVQPIAQAKLPARPSSITPEETYWRSFKSPLNLPSPTKHPVTHVSQPQATPSGQASPEFFVVTTGARVQLYSHKTRKLLKTITRFDDIAYSGEARYDGRVLAAGDETGAIQVFDVNSRAILKTWKEQKQPVHAVKWSRRETTALMSCGDDRTVRLWDLPSDTSVQIFRGHMDYVRTGSFLPGHSSNLMVSGSYDQTVRLWDPRVPNTAVMTFKHIAAVEDILCMPSGTAILASAENQIAVLDIVAGRPLQMIKNHQKTVTSLCLASDGSRVVSGGLDGHLKVFETTGWNVVAGSKYPAGILSLSVIAAGNPREDKHVVVGMSTGQLSIRTRLSGEQKVKERERQKQMDALIAGTIEEYDKKQAKKRPRGFEKRLRGRDYAGEDADIIVEGNSRPKQKKAALWEKELHSGRYREALDSAVRGTDKLTIVTLLNTLRYRSALRAALEDRTEADLQPIMLWIWRNIGNTALVPLCVELSMNIMDLYSKHLSESDTLAKHVKRLRERVHEETTRAQEAAMTKGMLELLTSQTPG